MHFIYLFILIFFYFKLYNIVLAPPNIEMLFGFPGGASGKAPICQCRRHKRRECEFNLWIEQRMVISSMAGGISNEV